MITTEQYAIENKPETNLSYINTGVNIYFTLDNYKDYEINKIVKSIKPFFIFYPKKDRFYLSIVEDESIEIPLYMNNNIDFLYKFLNADNNIIKYKCYNMHKYGNFLVSFYMDFSVLNEMKPFAYYNEYNNYILNSNIIAKQAYLKKNLLKPAKNQPIDIDLSYSFQLNPFNYQKNNIDWMIKLEKMFDLNLNKFELFTTDLREFTVNENKFYASKSKLIYDASYLEEISEKKSYNIRGGILHDEVGLGKTFSMLGLIFNTLPNNRKLTFYPKKLTTKEKNKLKKEQTEIYYTNSGEIKSSATLVICPARLCAQWEDELNKYLKPNSDVRMYTISTVVNYNKLMSNLPLLSNADVIFVSTNIFTNKNYIKESEKEGNYSLNEIYWHRIIFDEGHEVLHNTGTKRIVENNLYNYIISLRSEYKWVCSGTPLPYNDRSLDAILSFLTNNDFKSEYYYKFTQEQLDDILLKYFRFNTKKSVNDQIYIPKISEKTIFLKQTPLEKTVYDNALGEELRLIQLCTHILISEVDSEILGHEVKSLSDVQNKMIKHFDKLIKKENDDIKEREKKIEIQKNLYENVDNEYKKFSEEWKEARQSCKNKIKYHEDKILLIKKNIEHLFARQSHFTSLNERIKKITQELCPICYDHIEDITLTKCSHIFCAGCIKEYGKGKKNIECPMCRTNLDTAKDIGYGMKKDIDPDPEKDNTETSEYDENIDKWGTKMAYLIKFLQLVISQDESSRIIIFSQWKKMLELVSSALDLCNIKNVHLKGNIHVMSKNIRRFKNDKNIRVIMLSSETCCSGSNLTEASHIVLLDTVNGEKGEANAIEEQAIGRSARLGQKKSVKVIRLIMKDTIENVYYNKNVGHSFTGVEEIGSAKQLKDMFTQNYVSESKIDDENIVIV